MAQPDWYKPPQTAAASSERSTQYEPGPEHTARFWIRAAAYVIDVVFGMGAAFIGGLTLGLLRALGAPLPLAHVSPLEMILLGVPLTIVERSIAESVGGATLGKVFLGLRVLRADGAPCPVGGAIKRAIALYIDLFFFAMVAYGSMNKTPWNQRVGDRWGDTIVVHANAMPDDVRRTDRALIGAMIAFALACAFHLAVSQTNLR